MLTKNAGSSPVLAKFFRRRAKLSNVWVRRVLHYVAGNVGINLQRLQRFGRTMTPAIKESELKRVVESDNLWKPNAKCRQSGKKT